MYAISPRAKGDITLQGDATSNDHVAWCDTSCGAYMQTPLVYGDYLYACRDNGVLTCYRAKSGQRVYRERLGSGRTGFTASPVAANDKLYFTSEEGDVYVVQAGAEFKVLAENPLGEVCMATPAISEGVIFFRTRDHLVAIAKPKGKARKAGRSR
jgi:outer membrane protein assembly factor BamB